jgi:hypothetical protein
MQNVNHNSQRNIFILRNDLPYQTLETLSASPVILVFLSVVKQIRIEYLETSYDYSFLNYYLVSNHDICPSHFLVVVSLVGGSLGSSP